MPRIEFAICVTTLLAAFGLGLMQDTSADDFVVIAHRGASGYLPEHTLEAVAMAHAMNCDFIEQDVVLSKDNIPIVLHDIHLETVTNVASRFPNRNRKDGRYYAIDFTLEEIKSLIVHERVDIKTGMPVFPNRFPSHAQQTKGIRRQARQVAFRVPTLAEEIELIQGLNRSTGRNVGIYPEIKQPSWHQQQNADIAPMVVQVLKDYGYTAPNHNVLVQCFEAETLRRIRTQKLSKVRMVQLMGKNHDEMHTPAGLNMIREYAEGIGPSMESVLTSEDSKAALVARAHQAGLFVHAYTHRRDALPKGFTSSEDLVKHIKKLGVDGVFSDFPDILRSQSHRIGRE